VRHHEVKSALIYYVVLLSITHFVTTHFPLLDEKIAQGPWGVSFLMVHEAKKKTIILYSDVSILHDGSG